MNGQRLVDVCQVGVRRAFTGSRSARPWRRGS